MGEKPEKLLEIEGLSLPESALLEAEAVIHGWERSDNYRAMVEAVKIYKIIAEALSQTIAGTKQRSD